MDRKGLEQLIFDTYSVEPDYPWMDTLESAVFRHAANRKWFALVTTVPEVSWVCRTAAGGYREPEM